MAGPNQETLLLTVDVVANNARLAELARDTRKAKEEFETLKKSVKATGGDMALVDSASVRLKSTLSTLGQEQRVLEKANSDQLRVLKATPGSIEQLRAQLSLGTAEYNRLTAAERDNSEAGQQLQAKNKALSDNLKVLEAAVGDTRRNVGNYGSALADLLPLLVKAQEQQKRAAPDSKAYHDAEKAVIGFRQAATDAAIKAGLSQDQLNDKFETTAAAIRPATVALVRLEEEQERVGKGSAAYTAIGFKIGQAKKAIEQTTTALKAEQQQAGRSTSSTKGFVGSLLEAVESTGLLSGVLGKVREGEEFLAKAQEVATTATEGQTGALGALKAALISTGIGALVVLLGSLAAILSTTRGGSDLLARQMGGLGAVLDLVKTKAGAATEALFGLGDEKQQRQTRSFGDLVKENIINRLTAGRVAAEGLLSLDFKKVADGILQASTGFTQGTDRLKAFTKEAGNAYDAGTALAQQQRDLTRAENDNITTNKSLLNQVERLKNIRDNEFNTISQRTAANEQAYRVELEREAKLVKLAEQRIAVRRAEVAQKGGRRFDEEAYKRQQEAENELADIREDAAGKQNELITNRYQLEQAALQKLVEAKAGALNREAAEIDQQLDLVKKGSDEELALLQDKLNNAYQAEINAVRLTNDQKKAADIKYQTESLKLARDFQQTRNAAGYAATLAGINAQLTTVEKGSKEETRLRVQAIHVQLAAELDALDQRRDNAEQEKLLRAKAAQAVNDVNYNAALAKLNEFLQQQRNAVELAHAQGKTSNEEYQQAILVSDQLATGTRLQLAKDFNQDTTALAQANAQANINALNAVTQREKETYAERVRLASDLGGQIGALFIEVLNDTGSSLQEFAAKVLILILDGLEKATIAATTQSIIDGAAKGPVGLIEAAAKTAVIVAAFEGAKAALTASTAKPFAANTGGIVPGPAGSPNKDTVYSHLTVGEAVISRGAVEQFGPLLGHLNALGGGVNFAPGFAAPTLAARSFDGGLMARQVGNGAATAAEIAAALERADIRANVDFTNFSRAKDKWQRPEMLTSLGGGRRG